MIRPILLGAIATPLALIGGMLLGVLLGGAGFAMTPGHLGDTVRTVIAMLPAFLGAAAGGAVWGYLMWRITDTLTQNESRRAMRVSASTRAGERARMLWAGALGFGLTMAASTLLLTVLEQVIVERGQGPRLPIHNVFTLLFVPAAALVAGGGGLALGLAEGDRTFALRVGLSSALAGALAFLAVNLVLDSLGFRVGAPGAAERATMVLTALSGSFAAAAAGGAVVGGMLASRKTALAAAQMAIPQA